MKKLLIVIFLCVAINTPPLFAQNSSSDQSLALKYWHYRDRLKYFVTIGVNGQQRGEGMVSGVRNKHSTDVISYGDQMVHMGYYLGVLATEYALLVGYGQDPTATLQELNIALDCYVRDDLCESRMPWYKNYDLYDGFHMRQDVPETFIVDHPSLNEGLDPTDIVGTLDPGTPAWVEHVSANDYKNWEVEPGGTPYLTFQSDADMKTGAMSQDNAIGLLKGLALVHKCIPSGYYAHEKASEIANKVISKMWGGGSWVILDPNNDPVPRGSDAYFYAVPLTVINIAMDNPALPSPILAQNANLSWQALQYIPLDPMNNCMTMTMASLCDCWNGSLVGLAGFNTTSGCIYQLTEQDNWDTFYLLLWEFLHDKSSSSLSMGKARDQLVAAPCNGPYCYDSLYHDHAENGWAATYKFEQCEDYQNHGKIGSQGNYNGLDYMLLYNLYRLINARNNQFSGPYQNMVRVTLGGSLPYCVFGVVNQPIGTFFRPLHYYAMQTIHSTQNVDIYVHPLAMVYPLNSCPNIGDYNPAYITYRAGKTITLNPGFRAAQGAYFHAYIDPFDCALLQKANTESGNQAASELDPSYAMYQESIGEWSVQPALETYMQHIEATPNDTAFPDIPVSAYPNPFNEQTTIHFSLPDEAEVDCCLYDIHGVVAYRWNTSRMPAGPAVLSINGQTLKPGQYCCVITAGGWNATVNIIKE